MSARVLSATDDGTQSQTDNTIKQVTDHAVSEMDKPNDMHASDEKEKAHNTVLFNVNSTLHGHNFSFNEIGFSSLIGSRFAFMRW